MALLRLAEWVLLSKTTQGCNVCRDKTPPRADQVDLGSGSSTKSLESVPAADPAIGFQCVNQDARTSIACNRKGTAQ